MTILKDSTKTHRRVVLLKSPTLLSWELVGSSYSCKAEAGTLQVLVLAAWYGIATRYVPSSCVYSRSVFPLRMPQASHTDVYHGRHGRALPRNWTQLVTVLKDSMG